MVLLINTIIQYLLSPTTTICSLVDKISNRFFRYKELELLLKFGVTDAVITNDHILIGDSINMYANIIDMNH